MKFFLKKKIIKLYNFQKEKLSVLIKNIILILGRLIKKKI